MTLAPNLAGQHRLASQRSWRWPRGGFGGAHPQATYVGHSPGLTEQRIDESLDICR